MYFHGFTSLDSSRRSYDALLSSANSAFLPDAVTFLGLDLEKRGRRYPLSTVSTSTSSKEWRRASCRLSVWLAMLLVSGLTHGRSSCQ